VHHVRFRDHDGNVRTGGYAPDAEQITSHPSDRPISLAPETFDPEEVRFLPPCEPSKVVCVGRNYADHADEMGSDVPDRPLLFLKPPNTLAAHGERVSVLPDKERIDYEAELAVVVGERAKGLSEDNAMDAVAGFTCVNDLSNRDDQMQEQNWVRGKAFDDSCPVGPVVATPDEVPDDAAVRCRLNGETVQDASRSQFIFDIPELLAEITTYLTLEPGDVVSTGTPAGVGPVADGDTVEVEVEGVGTLRNEIHVP
jgi:2-keto-4-pentenoate hydratase/2-oxohepta-3-ene-1,7-dioic acid hydratase in catechol pathway